MDEFKNWENNPETNAPDNNTEPLRPEGVADDRQAPADKAPEVPPYIPPYVPPVNNENADATEDVKEEKVENADTTNKDTTELPPPPKAPAERMGTRSNEYRYVPPYANGTQVPPAYRTERPFEKNEKNDSVPPVRPEAPKKEKPKKVKQVRTFSTAALVLILVGCVLLSFASGMLGALLVENGLDLSEPTTETEEIDKSDKNDNTDKTDKNDKIWNDLVIDKNDKDDDESGKLVGDYDLSDVCSVVSVSVVEITTEFTKAYYGHYQYVQEGAGSGVIISSDGYLLTNSHVITDSESGKLADTIKVRLTSGDEYEATIIGNDADSDIALLKIEGEGFAAATVGNSDEIEVGEQIIAVGNPLGELGGTVTSGIISATNREITVENNKMTLIQIDAAINPGNSGGGLFNTNGELIGIVNAKTTDVTVEGLGFAIPINEAVSVAEELQSHGYVTGKTYIGISLADVTDAFTAYYYFRSESTGVYVTSVQEGYNDEALQYGDRITSIEGNEVSSSSDVKEYVQESEVGDKLTFSVSRDGKIIDVEVTCYEYVPDENVSFDDKEG